MRRFLLLLPLFALPLEAAKPKGVPAINDLPAPYNFQATVLNKSVSLAWEWPKPEHLPAFDHFGFEVMRGTTAIGLTASTGYTDVDVPWGSHIYKVRARGAAKERGKRVEHISDWSAPADATIRVTCSQAPVINLSILPTKSSYSSIPSLRLHLTGDVSMPAGCSLTKASYHIDTGTGILHTGPLRVSPKGQIDEYVNAIGPEDELPAGPTMFTITVTAENEAGPTTSSAFDITLRLQNPYAPR